MLQDRIIECLTLGEGVTDMGVVTRLGCLGLQYKYEKLLIGILPNFVP